MQRLDRVLVFAIALLQGGIALAGGTSHFTGPILHATYVSLPMMITGKTLGREWNLATATRALTGPINPVVANLGASRTYRTHVKALWNRRTLYIKFICHGLPQIAISPRHEEPLYQHDVVEIFLDVSENTRHYVEIEVNPTGVNAVYFHTWDSAPDYPANHINGKFEASHHHERAGTLQGLKTLTYPLKKKGHTIGWVAEMAIPTGSLLARGHQGKALYPGQHFRANFVRFIYLPAEPKTPLLGQLNWIPTMLGQAFVSPMAMGTIILSKGQSGR